MMAVNGQLGSNWELTPLPPGQTLQEGEHPPQQLGQFTPPASTHAQPLGWAQYKP